MSGRILTGSEQIVPGETLTVYVKPYWVDADTVKNSIVQLFQGTHFPVSSVAVDIWGNISFSGTATPQPGLTTTLPGRNITGDEWVAFVNSRLNLASGAVGNVVAQRVEVGDTVSSPPSLTTVAYVGVGLLALAVLAYLLSGVGRVAEAV